MEANHRVEDIIFLMWEPITGTKRAYALFLMREPITGDRRSYSIYHSYIAARSMRAVSNHSRRGIIGVAQWVVAGGREGSQQRLTEQGRGCGGGGGCAGAAIWRLWEAGVGEARGKHQGRQAVGIRISDLRRGRCDCKDVAASRRGVPRTATGGRRRYLVR
eukprot:3312610-Pyramimonas_sp.AAC.1